MLNKVILIGNVGKTPEKRTTTNGNSVCNFSLATSERYKSRDGEMVDKTEWHNVVTWGKTADLVEQYLTKGKRACVEGKLQTREWTDKEDQKRYTTEIVASNVVFLTPKSEGGQSDNPPDDVPF